MTVRSPSSLPSLKSWGAVALLAVAWLAGLRAPGAQAQAGLPGTFVAQTIVGPDPTIDSLGNIALSRDGSGGVVWLAQSAGVDHVWASIETQGAWGAPVQLDGGLAGPSSQPVIAAADNGRLAVAFVSGGAVYAAVRAAGTPATPDTASFAAPQLVAAAASSPAFGMSVNGTAYMSYTVPNQGVPDLYAARMDRTAQAFAGFSQPLNLNPSHGAAYNAPTRSQLVVATDGDAVVVWGEDNGSGQTHVIADRVSGAGPSAAPQDLTVPSLNGESGGSADSPVVSAEDVSDFAWVAFRETFFQGSQPVSRVIARQQLGTQFDTPVVIDPLPFPTSDSADGPSLEMDGLGNGLATVELGGSHQVFADPLQNPDFGSPERLDSAVNTIAPTPQTAIGGVDDLGAVAWLQSTGPSDPPSVHLRPYDGSGFTTEAVVSQPSFGPVSTTAGDISAAADHPGDVFVAFLQGAPSSTRLVIGGVANPPSNFTLKLAGRYSHFAQPRIAWQPASDPLGIAGYDVFLGGKLMGTTTATSLQIPSPLPDGLYNVTVTAVNRYAQVTRAPTLALFVRTAPPHATLSISGQRSAGSSLRFTVRASETPVAHSPGVAANGVRIGFGDGSSVTASHASHAYGRAGSYTVSVSVRDRAGNVRALHQRIRIR